MNPDRVVAHPVFWVCVAAAFLWNLGVLLWAIRRKGRALWVQVPADALFAARWVSGFSRKNLWTRLGGARNCLFVALTPERLLVRPHFPFNVYAGGLDQEHDLPLSEVASVKAVRGAVEVALPGRVLVLWLRKPQLFLEAWARATRVTHKSS